MASDVLGLKYPLRTFPYTDTSVTFDISETANRDVQTIVIRQSQDLNPEGLELVLGAPKKQKEDDWEIDVRPLVSSKKWLAMHGLVKNKLDVHNVLPRIGFPRSEKYDQGLKKPITSLYAYGLFNQVRRRDGKTFRITCNKEKLQEIEDRLQRAIHLFKRRLQWLTTDSRRFFGVIQEHCVCIVLDIKNMSPQQFDAYRYVTEMVLRQQVSMLAKFNIMHAAEDANAFSPKAVPVSAETIEQAVDWLWKLDRLAQVSRVATCETVLHALEDHTVECLYLFSEGCSSEGSKQILKEKLAKSAVPVHIVSYNCTSAETIKFLKELAGLTGGRFHGYGVIMEMDAYEGVPPEPDTVQATIVRKKKTFGGVPPSAECREDVILIFDQLEEARTTLGHVTALLKEAPDPEKKLRTQKVNEEEAEHEEHYMSSMEWLARNGLRARQLGFYDVLSSVAFKHCDGVVDVKDRPPSDSGSRDAVRREKLVNAKYCDRFAHVPWKDGRIVHVQVTPDIHRVYEQRMIVQLNQIKTRIEWLQHGSRALFGTVIEDQVYILIDTSASMDPTMQFVKEKIYLLMQEQLRHKLKFNLVSFNSKVKCWRDRLVEVNEPNLQEAWGWVRGLQCSGSTNTLGALKFALNDPATQAIYMVTDGRPDQLPKTVLSQVHLREAVPIHTISFNCADAEANTFLCQLAKETGGRYHYYSEHGYDPDGPEPWESEDIRLLKDELITGQQNLSRVSNLRDECLALAWSKDPEFTKKKERRSSSTGNLPHIGRSTPPSYSSSEPYRSAAHASHRKKLIKPTLRYSAPASRTRRSESISVTSASHTKSSLLRAMSITGKVGDDWLLPETRDLLERQLLRQKRAIEDQVKKMDSPRKPKRDDRISISSAQWLRKNSLAAQKLTLMDVLGPTIVPHNPKYVPIIDKNVLAKVFDEILPVAHVSKEKKVRLVNPDAIDLLSYEKRLQKAIDSYHRRLNNIIFKMLPEHEKQHFTFPLEWDKDRDCVMDALERCDWPVRRSDISLLEEEIEQAEKYIDQSVELRTNSKANTDEAGSEADPQEVQKEVEVAKRQETIEEEVIDDEKDDEGSQISSRSRDAQSVLSEASDADSEGESPRKESELEQSDVDREQDFFD